MPAAAVYPALEALGDAWSPDGALELLNELVLPRAWPGRMATRVSVEDVSHIPGRACTVLYLAGFDDGAPPRRVTATFAKDDRLTRVFAEHYGGGEGDVAGEPDRPVVLVPERRCLVEFFGMDWQLPAMARATDPGRIAPVLSRVGSCRPADIEVLRYRPHQRCVLLYTGGRRNVIGKVYRRVEQAERVWGATRALAGGGVGGIVIPAPLALVDRTLLLAQHVEGEGWLQAVVGAHAPRGTEAIVSSAAAVAAELHAFAAGGGEPDTFGSELLRLRARIARMAPAAPQLAEEASALLDRLCAGPAVGRPGRMTLVHGDFKPDQLLLSPRGVAVLDFDRVGPGDPAVDLGNFIAQLHREALLPGREWLRTLAEPFLAEYERLTGAGDVADRARCVRTLALVRMAVRRFVHFPHLYARGGTSSSPAPLLAEAASCLG